MCSDLLLTLPVVQLGPKSHLKALSESSCVRMAVQVNPGAISTCACVHPGVAMSVRFRYFMHRLSGMAGGELIGFSEVKPGGLCRHCEAVVSMVLFSLGPPPL